MKKSLLVLVVMLWACGPKATSLELFNVSYDPTREFYREFNTAFEKHWQKSHIGQKINFRMSHGGSGKQARSVIDGLDADVVTLALAADIDVIARETKLLSLDWQKKLPGNSAPYTSTIVFVVRKGNPKNIKDWNDLIKPGVSVITPNPKTSGGARWNFLAAWGFSQEKKLDSKNFVKSLYTNVAVLDTGARGATTTFTQRKIGDVLIAWENEAYLAMKEKPGEFEVIMPGVSILAEPCVALVDANAAKKGSSELGKAYLDYLYSEEGQRIAGKNFFRPINAQVAKEFAHVKPMKLVTIDGAFGGWAKANKEYFSDGGIFDQIYGK